MKKTLLGICLLLFFVSVGEASDLKDFLNVGGGGSGAVQTALYAREDSDKWIIKGLSTAADRYTIKTPIKLQVEVNGELHEITSATEYDLSASATWDTTGGTDYTVAANRAGLDFYVYVLDNSGTTLIELSANSTVPDGYTAATSRKIGGFHCLCVAVGTISGHDLTNFVAGDVLPASIWDYHHKPTSSPEGMVYDTKSTLWVDIYLASGTGGSTASVYNVTITDIRDWNDFIDDGGAVGKRMLGDAEFQLIADGSNEETNISGSADPGTTGGHSDTASRRMISNIGCEDCCGVMWQWLTTSSARLDDGTAVGWYNLPNSKGSFYTYGTNSYGNTQLLAGANWSPATYSGSRARNANDVRWIADTYLGCRFAAEPAKN